MSESGRSCVFASLGDNCSEKSERKQMEKNKAEISRKSLKSEEKRRALQMADTEALLEFNKIKEIWKELALTEWARKQIDEAGPLMEGDEGAGQTAGNYGS